MHRTLKLLLMATGLALAGANLHAADYTMRISHQFPPAHDSTKRLEAFAKEVNKQTDGKVEVQLYGSAQLYKPSQNHAAVASGEIESAVILNLQWGGSLPEMAVLQIPFLASSPAKQRAFIDSDAARMLDKKMLSKGVRNIAWMVDTNNLVFTSHKELLDSPEKYKGLKVRGFNKIFDAGFVAMGATPVSMPGSEAYQALQTHVVDAAPTAVKAAISRKYYEVQDYGFAMPIFVVTDNLVVNPSWWDGLPEDVKAGIQRAADKVVKASITPTEGVDPEDLAKLNELGMEAVEATPDQLAQFKQVLQPAIEKAFLKSSGKDGQKLLDMIKDL